MAKAITSSEDIISSADANDEPDIPERRRVIRYFDDDDGNDIEAVPRPAYTHGSLRRRGSASSSLSGRRGFTSRTVDPSVLLPIEYRTVSFHIEDSKERKHVDTHDKISQATATDLADLTWHKLSVEDVCHALRTSVENGLTDDQVQEATAKYGKNVPSKPSSQLPRKIFWYFFGGFGSILFIGAILVFIAWRPLGEPNPSRANLALAIVLAAVWVIQAIFNGWQDFSSSRVMDSITGMLPEDCLIVRNGTQTIVPAAAVVPGDIIHIRAGDKLPADLRFIELSGDTKFDRSILTGESLPIAGTVQSTDSNYLETKCIGLQGTHCILGACRAIVVSTGDKTVFGRIAALTNRPDTRRTLLQKEVLRFVIIICSLAAFFIVLVIAIWGGYLQKEHTGYLNVVALIVSCVSVGIAFVPEGLPIALTASMTIVANIMKKENVLCKSLRTVETLGCVNVVCSDKTGTLTKNLMTVTDCSVSTEVFSASQASQLVATDNETASAVLKELRKLAVICNAGEFDATTVGKPLEERKIIGDATDQAVLRFAESLGPHEKERAAFVNNFDIPFNSKNKFMLRVFSPSSTSTASKDGKEALVTDEENYQFLAIKGAPDVLLPRCSTIMNKDGSIQELDEVAIQQINKIKDEWSSQGKRVILFARNCMPPETIMPLQEESVLEYVSGGLTLVGLLAIVDPPRSEIPDVINTLRGAGIRVFMVTGDFKLTALAIARDCGIVTATGEIDDVSALSPTRKNYSTSVNDGSTRPEDMEMINRRAIVMSGPELSGLNDDRWASLCKYDEIVFARTTPEQKLRIVKEFQKRENIVAMTGDGVNDAPSLKAADVGVAIHGGSDIAVEAADMVLLDSFSGIVQAVLYGRVIFDNLKKTIIYLLPAGTFSEFWPVFTNVVFGLPQILSSFLMIMICCLTDCAAAMTLALEKPEADVLRRKPRNPKREKLVDWRLLTYAYFVIGLIECTSSFAMAYWHAQRRGVPFDALWFTYGDYGNLDEDFVTQVLNESSSIYFVNLVIMQFFNLLAVRTRRLSLLQHPPIFRKRTQNLAIFPAFAFALAVIFIFCYIPGVQAAIASTQVPVEFFFFPVAFGVGLLLIDEARKAAIRKWPGGLVAKAAW